MKAKYEVDVLIVGGGASGLSASMLLSSYGVSTHLASRHPTTSILPKAHIISIKSMEMFREFGLDESIRAIATPPENMRYSGYYAGFVGPGEDYGRPIVRIGAWGRGGQDVEWEAASHVAGVNLMQSRLEPLMKAKAEALAPESVHFNTNFVDFEETSLGVLATLENRETGETYQVAARYLLACDGGRVVGPKLGVEMEGHVAVATSISIQFAADLSPWFHDSEVLTYTCLNPDTGIPCVLIHLGPKIWGAQSAEWLVHMVSFAGDHKSQDDATAIAAMKQSLGLPDLDAKILVINRWPLDAVVASKFRVGRAFMLGDAAHRWPPAGGHGLNMAIQDAYNLCWKLAAVIKRKAGEDLLDTYERERRPVAQQFVEIAFTGWEKTKDFMGAIGFSPRNSSETNWANIRKAWQEGPEGDAARRRISRTLPGILPNFNSLNVGFGYTYDDGAIVPDGPVGKSMIDPLGTFHPSTRPGHSLPHAWVETLLGRVALGDRVGRGRFVLIAGESGQAWKSAAERVAEERGIALDAFTVGGTEGDLLDMRHAWDRLREHGPDGAILVRPDRFIGWRARQGVSDPLAELRSAFDRLLTTGDTR